MHLAFNSKHLRKEMPRVEGFSESNDMPNDSFSSILNILEIFHKLLKICEAYFGGHHRYIINKCSGTPDKALLYVRQTLEHG